MRDRFPRNNNVSYPSDPPWLWPSRPLLTSCGALCAPFPTYICQLRAPKIQAMFMFNKNNALPRSRQSSIDSLVTDPSVSTSTSDAWVSQCSDASSYGEMPSPEHRARVHPGKRSSVFNLRSRSNTASSATSSFVSLTPSTMAGPDTSSHRSSQDLHHLAGQSFMDFPGSKRSIFRGKKGKRLSGHFSPSFTVEEGEEADVGSKRASVLRKSRRATNQSESSRK